MLKRFLWGGVKTGVPLGPYWWLNPFNVKDDAPFAEFFRVFAVTLLWLLPAWFVIVRPMPSIDEEVFWSIVTILLCVRQAVVVMMVSLYGAKGYYAFMAAEAAWLGASALEKAHQRDQQRQAQLTAQALYQVQQQGANRPYSMNTPRY